MTWCHSPNNSSLINIKPTIVITIYLFIERWTATFRKALQSSNNTFTRTRLPSFNMLHRTLIDHFEFKSLQLRSLIRDTQFFNQWCSDTEMLINLTVVLLRCWVTPSKQQNLGMTYCENVGYSSWETQKTGLLKCPSVKMLRSFETTLNVILQAHEMVQERRCTGWFKICR